MSKKQIYTHTSTYYIPLQEESFLEDVNMILNTADIPNLYENEERLEIIEKVIHIIALVHPFVLQIAIYQS